MDIIYKAQVFATAAHAAVGQRRKYTNEPYINHPAEVVDIIRRHTAFTDNMLAAAWLHDVVEDTGVTQDVVVHEFGADIGEMVKWLTDQSRPEDGNRATRKKMDADRLAMAPAIVQTIKYADLISNTSSIMSHDEDFGRVYLKEKSYLLSVMDKGDSILYKMALSNIA